MKRLAYVDTSAYLAVLLGEAESAAVRKRLSGYSLCSSTLLLIECERNLITMARERLLSVKEFERAMARLRSDAELFVLRDLTPDLCLTGDFPAVHAPRSSDLVHLRTARWFALQPEGLARFESLDTAQMAAAEELGLPVSR